MMSSTTAHQILLREQAARFAAEQELTITDRPSREEVITAVLVTKGAGPATLSNLSAFERDYVFLYFELPEVIALC